jgi:hypothetical protein
MERTTLGRVARQAQMSASRATVRDFEDNHLVQEITEADVFHSETASNQGAPLERWQMVGMTAVPLKQEKEEKKQGQQGQQQQAASPGSAGASGAEWNHEQPKGKSAEALMLYMNGSRAHPVALVDDRRVRPYNMKEGEAAFYDPTGSEQMTFFNEKGAYLVSLDGPDVKDKKKKKERFASIRHVAKDMQSHEVKKGQKREDYAHEGKTVNTEVRLTASRIEFRVGDSVVGYYDKSGSKWHFNGQEFETKVKKQSHVVDRFETVGPTFLGLDEKDEIPPKTVTEGGPAKKTYAKLA